MPSTKEKSTPKTEARGAVEARRADLKAAEQRLRSLSEEASALPGKLREALGEAASQRAEAARQGESAAHVPADLDVEDLRQRQEQIKLELWAQRIATEEARLTLLDHEEELAQVEYREAQERFEELKPKYEKLKAEFEAARGRANVDPWNSHRTAVRKEVQERLHELRGTYPGVLDA